MVNVLDYEIAVKEFDSNRAFTFTFGLRDLEKHEPTYPPTNGLNSTITVFLEGGIWH